MARQDSGPNESGSRTRATRPAVQSARRRLLVPGVTALAVVVLLAATLLFTRQAPSRAEASCAAKGAATGLTVGACAPNFMLAEPDGHRVSLADFQGQPVLLHFWAVACTTCAAEYPDFSRAVAVDQPKGLRVLAVDAWGEPGAMVQQWRRSHHLPATFLIDQPEAVVRQYGVQGTPTTFFIDRSGHIKAANSGPLSYAAFQQNVGKIV